MTYEPGSLECRSLIDAKENIVSAIKSLSSINQVQHLKEQLLQIYNELEGIHDLRREKENTIPVTSSKFLYMYP